MRVPKMLKPLAIKAFRLSEGRRIDLTLFLPRGRSSCPVVIFSHGNPVPPRFYYYLARAWRRRGIATLFVSHLADGEDVRSPAQWPVRGHDLKRIIPVVGQIHPRLDPSRIAVAGHSHGAHTAAMLAGVPLVLPREGKRRKRKMTMRDPRVKAFIMISPPNPGMLGLRNTGWKQIRKPYLVLVGSRERHQGRYRSMVVIRGAAHSSFIDAMIFDDRGTLTGFQNRRILAETQEFTTGFLGSALG